MKETTYFVVVERVRVTGSGAIAVSGTASGSEDTGAAEGWSIGDGSATYSPQAAAQGWASDAFSYKIEVRGSSINNPAAGEATVTGTAQVGETLTADTSGIADADGLSNVSYAYQWIRTDGGTNAGIAGATDSTYTLTGDDQGKTIKLKVTFNDDKGNSETLAIVAAADVGESEQKPQFLVSNLGVGVGGAVGIQRPLSAARSGFAQAFTTGAKTGGYAMGSVGIQVSQFADESTVGDHLQVTINGVASDGEPGDAHCALTNPSRLLGAGRDRLRGAGGRRLLPAAGDGDNLLRRHRVGQSERHRLICTHSADQSHRGDGRHRRGPGRRRWLVDSRRIPLPRRPL